jgi:hypothetical protein
MLSSLTAIFAAAKDKRRENGRPKLAVFFDADNLSLMWAASILKQLSANWDVHLRRAYGFNLAAHESILRGNSIIPVEVLRNTQSKNSADVALAVDATEELCLGMSDGICIVSGDSDFTRLVQKIREKGKAAISFGNATTPPSLRNACTEFHLATPPKPIAKVAPVAQPAVTKPKQKAVTKAATKAVTQHTPKGAAKPTPQKTPSAAQAISPALAMELRQDLQRTFREFEASSGESSLQSFGQFLAKNYPQFNQRHFGFSRLRALLGKVGGFDIEAVLRADGTVGDYRLSIAKDSGDPSQNWTRLSAHTPHSGTDAAYDTNEVLAAAAAQRGR